MIEEWDAELERMHIELAHLRHQRDSAQPGTTLWLGAQDDADRVHYRLRAYQCARPVLSALWQDYRRELAACRAYQEDASARVSAHLRTLAGAGLLAVVALLAWLGSTGPWWLIAVMILSVLAAVASAAGAVRSTWDHPDTARSAALRARIHAIQRACEHVEDAAGLAHVQAVVHPAPETLPDRRHTQTTKA